MEVSTSHELRTLILSRHPLILIETIEEERAQVLLKQIADELNVKLRIWTITNGLSGFPNTSDPDKMLRNINKDFQSGIFLLKDFSIHLNNPVTIRMFKEVIQKFSKSQASVVMIGNDIQLSKSVQQHAIHFKFKLPDREQLTAMIRPIVSSYHDRHGVTINMTNKNWSDFIDALTGMTLNQARQTVLFCILENGQLDERDIEAVRKQKARLISDGGVLEFLGRDDNSFNLGGFSGLKSWLQKAKTGFSSQAKSLNLRPPKGVLIVGVQGCGKSLAAKVIAKEMNLPFLKLESSRLYDKYLGETEKKFRKAIEIAEAISPCVLWIDEIEKSFLPGNSDSAEGSLNTRLFGSFLTWLQEKNESVFVVATANNIFQLPPELQRKGRFDEVFFVDLPNESERAEIFSIHLKLRSQDPSLFDTEALVKNASGFTGAEIEQVVVSSLYSSLYKNSPLSTDIIVKELQVTVPLSVSRSEDIEKLRALAVDRFVSVSD